MMIQVACAIVPGVALDGSTTLQVFAHEIGDVFEFYRSELGLPFSCRVFIHSVHSVECTLALLFIERICYTWVHTFSTSFVEFTKTAVGKRMGKKPLDVVLTIFYINKVIQLSTFVGFYYFVIGFDSPWDAGFAFAKVRR